MDHAASGQWSPSVRTGLEPARAGSSHSTNSTMSKKSKTPAVDAPVITTENPSATPVVASEEKRSKKRKRDRQNEDSATVTPTNEDNVDDTESSEKKKNKKKRHHEPSAIDGSVLPQPVQPTLDEASEKALRKKEKKEKKKKDKTAAGVTTNGEAKQVRSILS